MKLFFLISNPKKVNMLWCVQHDCHAADSNSIFLTEIIIYCILIKKLEQLERLHS